MTFASTILTLYPEMFPGPLGTSLAGKALERGDWSCETVNPRDFTTDKHRTVDDTPAGGGAGMVLKCDVMAAALDSVADDRPILAMTPRGKPITQARIREIASGPGVTFICGRFEGFDERLFEALRALRKRLAEERGVPPYVIFGDATLIDMCRLRPANEAEMLEVNGVGAVKLERFGEAFLAEIVDAA